MQNEDMEVGQECKYIFDSSPEPDITLLNECLQTVKYINRNWLQW